MPGGSLAPVSYIFETIAHCKPAMKGQAQRSQQLRSKCGVLGLDQESCLQRHRRPLAGQSHEGRRAATGAWVTGCLLSAPTNRGSESSCACGCWERPVRSVLHTLKSRWRPTRCEFMSHEPRYAGPLGSYGSEAAMECLVEYELVTWSAAASARRASPRRCQYARSSGPATAYAKASGSSA